MQIVNGFVCMNCTDVDRAEKSIDPAHPNQAATDSVPRDAASPTFTQNAITFGGSLAHLNALDTRHPSGAMPGSAGASVDISA